MIMGEFFFFFSVDVKSRVRGFYSCDRRMHCLWERNC